MMGDAINDLGKLLDDSGAKVVFGLRQQGHFDIVTEMLAAGKSLDEIGKAIGWSGGAVAQAYGIEVRAEFEQLKQKQNAAMGKQYELLESIAKVAALSDIDSVSEMQGSLDEVVTLAENAQMDLAQLPIPE